MIWVSQVAFVEAPPTFFNRKSCHHEIGLFRALQLRESNKNLIPISRLSLVNQNGCTLHAPLLSRRDPNSFHNSIRIFIGRSIASQSEYLDRDGFMLDFPTKRTGFAEVQESAGSNTLA